ncbi:aspartyl/asparaginyl beta-hydroxylase isoform X1 [Dunckerocampus dactyliophorus]|uniref:aspartyl/asparaginyl beta-hydroxylase isoform X1 n=1 Tax=Dunckerocampus dactyliophorus TaxID=161453 RepID=UPI00240566FC|nr:aspartyl/asparaginyl beta-hydroxylase isoform X1 [Dunckerocampus dactyliophorus]
MQRYRHYGTSSSSVPVEELHTTEEEVSAKEQAEEPLVKEKAQDAIGTTGGGDVEEAPSTQEAPLLSDSKSPSSESKNGKKTQGADAAGGAKYSVFTWFVVLALLGVWSSVAVVYFDIVDYDSVIAKAEEFRMNFSQALQGKLTAYDTDGDGDFDVEDAKVLLDERKLRGPARRKAAHRRALRELAEDPDEMELIEDEIPDEATSRKNWTRGLKETPGVGPSPEHKAETAKERPTNQQTAQSQWEESREAASSGRHTEETPTKETSSEEIPVEEKPTEEMPISGSEDVDSEIQAAVPLPAFVEDSFVADDPRGNTEHIYAEDVDAIDTSGVLVEEPSSQESVAESAKTVTSSKFTQEEEPLVEVAKQSEPVEAQSENQADTVEPQSDTTGETAGSATEEAAAEEKPKEKAKKKKAKLLNNLDKTIKAEVDAAEKLRKKGKVEAALKAFEMLVQQHPQSPRARYGKAQAEDDLAEKMRSNDLLQKAINSYRDAAELPDATSDLVRAALKRRAERQQFLGRMRGAVATLERLVQIFPEDIHLKNDLGVAHLLLGDNKGAKKVYEEVLAAAPGDGFAKVHYGFILKSENQIAESIPYLKEGLESGEPGTDDGRFYFHLGDALQRVGDKSAYQWYQLGHERGHFASVWQRSLYNVDGLKAQPWWTPSETGYTDLVKSLERNWKTIRDEALAMMDRNTGMFVPEEENLREKGEWGQYTLWQQGRKAGDSCQAVPKTCSLLERFPEATGCKRGQIKFSVMQPGTHVWPHTGPTNCRLRMHLGLVIPKHGCRIRCTDQTREWEEGKVLIFDDSFEHEVWQEADTYRLIFIVDVWHPQLTAHQRQTLSAI